MTKYKVHFYHDEYPRTYTAEVTAANTDEAVNRAWDQVDVTFEGAEVFAQGLQIWSVEQVKDCGCGQ